MKNLLGGGDGDAGGDVQSPGKKENFHGDDQRGRQWRKGKENFHGDNRLFRKMNAMEIFVLFVTTPTVFFHLYDYGYCIFEEEHFKWKKYIDFHRFRLLRRCANSPNLNTPTKDDR